MTLPKRSTGGRISQNARSLRHVSLATLSLLAILLGACGGGGGGAPLGGGFGVDAVGETPTLPRHLDQATLEAGAVPLADVLSHGALVFAASFNTLDGAGRPTSTGTGASRPRREGYEATNRISGMDSNSCAGCHSIPRVGGGGDNVANVFVLAQAQPYVNFDGGEGEGFQSLTLDSCGNERNTLGMFGSGYIELLAREMTALLQGTRAQAMTQAQTQAQAVTLPLMAKSVSFGNITAFPDGTFDTSAVQGLDADLVVKPFHQKGVVISLREFTNNAMNHHHGIQASERFGAGVDTDGDGLVNELTEGDITAASLWQASLAPPGRVFPDNPGAMAAVQQGQTLFETPIAQGGVGCATCHVPYLELDNAVFTEPNPYNPPGNLRPENVINPVGLNLNTEGEGPRLPVEPTGKVRVPAFTDLKRHDMGAENAEPLVQGGVPVTHFITKKLWGFASEPPFMHHGRATTIGEAINMHGGEGAAARGAFQALSAANRDALIAFLKTLRVVEVNAPSIQTTAPFSGVIGEEGAVAQHYSQANINNGLHGVQDLFDHGQLLFAASFNTLDGAGRPESTGGGAPRARREAPQNFNRLSGPDANSCTGCHNLPGPGGGGDNVANVFVLTQLLPFVNFDEGAGENFQNWTLGNVGNERNTPGMWGAGFVELLAREMTADLQLLRAQAVAQAQATGFPLTIALSSKGVAFGFLGALPNGSVDSSGLRGVDADLIVKPFHQKGVVISLREFTNNAMNHHHGIQTSERFGTGSDPDQDGVMDELTEGDVTAVSLYQALLRVPGRRLPTEPLKLAAVQLGETLFLSPTSAGGIGCASCHRPELVLNDPVFSEPNPYNPIGNLQVAQVPQPFTADLTTNGPMPRLMREANGTVRVPLYSDLKRHDMGPENAEPLVQGGVPTSHFLTKKLWGFASEPPFMHHGRALTITEAIGMHGGEAASSRAAFNALAPIAKAALLDFLKTLQVVPEGGPLIVN